MGSLGRVGLVYALEIQLRLDVHEHVSQAARFGHGFSEGGVQAAAVAQALEDLPVAIWWGDALSRKQDLPAVNAGLDRLLHCLAYHSRGVTVAHETIKRDLLGIAAQVVDGRLQHSEEPGQLLMGGHRPSSR